MLVHGQKVSVYKQVSMVVTCLEVKLRYDVGRVDFAFFFFYFKFYLKCAFYK